MRKTFLMIACGFGLFANAALAEVLAVPVPVTEAPAVTLPAKGTRMAAVRQQFGEPVTQHPAAGGGAPRQPPITRWDYDGFSVFFENNHVIDAVIKGNPAPVHRTEELKAAE